MADESESSEALRAAKKKNAEAQASFRARRQTYIKSLEETVAGLEGVVKEMQSMCKTSTDEAKLLRERVAVLEGVIDEMTSRIERSAAISANKPNHCDCCRFLPPSRHRTPQPRDYRHSISVSGYPHPHQSGSAEWPREPYHPALGNAQGLSNPSQRLDTGHLERLGASQQQQGSAGTSSHTSSATSSLLSRDHDEYRNDGMPPALFTNVFNGDVYSNPLDLPGGMSDGSRFPSNYGAPPPVDSLSQQANFQAFMQHHLEPGQDPSQVALPQSQSERDLLTNFARSFGSTSMHRLDSVQATPPTPVSATSGSSMTMDYMFPSKDPTGPYMGPASSIADLGGNPQLAAFVPQNADPNSGYPQLRTGFGSQGNKHEQKLDQGMDETPSPGEPPKAQVLGVRPGMNARRTSMRSDGSSGLDPIAACSASGSSKVNGLPAKVARCEKTLREVQLALQSVKNDADEARNARPGGMGLKRRRLSESDFSVPR